ncbi:uncharacterized protein LOC131811671 isoform X4 [Mustela lutreola]|uniref:uncharacterized protein LOC131811671 isoform X4 n=1 Tax=Mustela lutreola TaxID=9666 RepID=UPI002797A8DB|nr:uncharacterized protein LOC131811671 isoform X4 [Mustela lutreola]
MGSQLHLPLPPPYFAPPPPARQGAEKKALPPGSPALECRLVAKLRISPKYPETRGSARARVTFFYDCELKSKNCCSRVVRLNANCTKELLLTSHLQSPPGHRQDHFNKPGSETPIVRNLQLATGYHHSLLFCKRKDLEGERLPLWKL